eukprot:CAMPEP_0117615704 /NCGR_PEP_ID=MMETSP0784-20121206/84674_1 /TAXON_ID=39447 /ORGANISM="" /LENGTH=69 /DNA_ID=CAMNT_0005419443 /DNA_START=543 /DNA_END=752 /DNA_ORIENTATION=+
MTAEGRENLWMHQRQVSRRVDGVDIAALRHTALEVWPEELVRNGFHVGQLYLVPGFLRQTEGRGGGLLL